MNAAVQRFENYGREMDALLAVVAARTQLPLVDLRDYPPMRPPHRCAQAWHSVDVYDFSAAGSSDAVAECAASHEFIRLVRGTAANMCGRVPKLNAVPLLDNNFN